MHYTTREAARLLGIGRNALVKNMRQWGMLHDDNVPTRKHIDAGHLITKNGMYWHQGIGAYRYSSSARITPEGLEYIQKKLDKGNQHKETNHARYRHRA